MNFVSVQICTTLLAVTRNTEPPQSMQMYQRNMQVNGYQIVMTVGMAPFVLTSP